MKPEAMSPDHLLSRILKELDDRLEQARRLMKESQRFGVITLGFNQDLGAFDALTSFHEFLNTDL